MSDLAETFNLPPELRRRADEITKKYRMSLAIQMAEELVDAGVPMELAFQITVGELSVSAARIAMMTALGLEKREPRRDLWMKRAEENFDEAREWFASIKDDGRAPLKNHRAEIAVTDTAVDRKDHVSPSAIRTAFLDQNVKLPLRLCDEDLGVVLDDDGVDVFTVDSNGGRPDEEVSAIALLILECVNAEAGFGEEQLHG